MISPNMLETSVNSFILRFVQGQPSENSQDVLTWHGVIRHVQSKQEIRFTHIEEALNFVASYVDIDRDTPADINLNMEEL